MTTARGRRGRRRRHGRVVDLRPCIGTAGTELRELGWEGVPDTAPALRTPVEHPEVVPGSEGMGDPAVSFPPD